MLILSINSGSTSLKCCLYDLPVQEESHQVTTPAWQADISWKGNASGTLQINKNGQTSEAIIEAATRDQAIAQILTRLWTADGLVNGPNEILAVAHRVVHGGPNYYKSTVIDQKVIDNLATLVELAPNHEQENIRAINCARAVLPKALQVASFDTAFFHKLPTASAIYAVPFDWYERDKLRRYGFHGISHEYLAMRANQMLAKDGLKLVTCHLGGGSSLSATDGKECLDTTMGFTPLEGLPMQTRSGSIDPGLIIHQIKYGGYSIDQLNTVLTKESGMKGLSGLSGDMREIEAQMAAGNSRAQLAFDVFVKALAKQAASLVPVLGRLDALVFSGGIGENSSNVRKAVCRRLLHLGIDLDEMKNVSGKDDRDISAAHAQVKALVIHTKEELAIAQSARQVYLASGATAWL
jgi:acetate kinase